MLFVDNIRIFDTFKPITVERLIVHARGLHTRLRGAFSYFDCSSLYFLIVRT